MSSKWRRFFAFGQAEISINLKKSPLTSSSVLSPPPPPSSSPSSSSSYPLCSKNMPKSLCVKKTASLKTNYRSGLDVINANQPKPFFFFLQIDQSETSLNWTDWCRSWVSHPFFFGKEHTQRYSSLITKRELSTILNNPCERTRPERMWERERERTRTPRLTGWPGRFTLAKKVCALLFLVEIVATLLFYHVRNNVWVSPQLRWGFVVLLTHPVDTLDTFFSFAPACWSLLMNNFPLQFRCWTPPPPHTHTHTHPQLYKFAKHRPRPSPFVSSYVSIEGVQPLAPYWWNQGWAAPITVMGEWYFICYRPKKKPKNIFWAAQEKKEAEESHLSTERLSRDKVLKKFPQQSVKMKGYLGNTSAWVGLGWGGTSPFPIPPPCSHVWGRRRKSTTTSSNKGKWSRFLFRRKKMCVESTSDRVKWIKRSSSQL